MPSTMPASAPEHAVHGYDEEKDDIYTSEGEERLLEDDEITAAEAAFMEGYAAEELLECSYCGKPLDIEKAVVTEIDGEERTFCSKACSRKYLKEHEEHAVQE